tara:strand:- start:774 stop:1112 length:339 start_codon:yes stop_codon:yes gene_type:complete
MRVKLSYTVEEEDVLAEAAKLVGLSAEDVQQAIGMFNDVQAELKGENDEDKVVNINKCLEMVEEFRKALFNLDTRLNEVVEIVKGYDEYKRSVSPKLAEGPPPDEPELFGAD